MSTDITWLGWAGVELHHDARSLVIDAIDDASAVFAVAARAGIDVPAPAVSAARSGQSVGALVTHLHRDHADASALGRALRSGAPVLEPASAGGSAATQQAETELAASGLMRRQLEPWAHETLDGFEITALPAVDGLGDSQLSWLVETGDARVVHLGDTMVHGHWWRIAERASRPDVTFVPINGPIVRFPHLMPPSSLPVAMDPEQAAQAVHILRTRLAIPIHYHGYATPGLYEPQADALARFCASCAALGVDVWTPEVGESLTIGRA